MALHSLRKRLAQLLDLVAGTAMLIMILLTFTDVVGRYGFNNSIFGASELIEWLMVAVVFAGFARITAMGAHIRVSLFETTLGRVGRIGMTWFSLVTYGLMAVALWVLTTEAWISGRGTLVLNLPAWIYAGAALVLTLAGMAALILAMLRPDPGWWRPEDGP
ncbi:MAG: TRAP transporter small permease [Pseudorhodobacter sp.]